jgi:hypothetical protein
MTRSELLLLNPTSTLISEFYESQQNHNTSKHTIRYKISHIITLPLALITRYTFRFVFILIFSATLYVS